MPMLVPVVLIVAGVVTLAHLAPFPFLFDAAMGEKSVWRMPQTPGQRQFYLTFDDGPNPTITPQLLDILRERQVQATFFLIGDHINADTAPIVRRMFAEGHAVGQHSGNRWQVFHSPQTLAAALQDEADRIEVLAGRRPCPMFRPHAGWRGVSMFAGLDRINYKLVGWSWLSWDWVWFRQRTGDRIAAQVVSHAAPGKIAVLHDGHHQNPRADRRYTLDAVPLIIERLRQDGYTFAPLCQPGPSRSLAAAPDAPRQAQQEKDAQREDIRHQDIHRPGTEEIQ